MGQGLRWCGLLSQPYRWRRKADGAVEEQTVAATVRELQFEDVEAVGKLAQAEGWGAPTRESWEHVWLKNPALRAGDRPLPRGWVLESDGRVVGSLGNLVQLYQLGDRVLRAAVASALVVAPEFRGQSMQLILAYSRQSAVDLLLNTTAAPQVSKIFEFLKFTRLPQPNYERRLYWVLRDRNFLCAAFRKKGFRRPLSQVASVGLAPLWWMEKKARGRLPAVAQRSLAIRCVRADAIGDEFNDLWQRVLAGNPNRLLGLRTAEVLRWRYAPRGGRHPPFLVAAYRGLRLMGYMVVARQDATHLGLRRARLVDLLAEQDDPNTVTQLVDTAVRQARLEGADMFEVTGFPENIRQTFLPYRPRQLVDDACPFLYQANDPEIRRALADPSCWYACLFDGDGS